MGRGQYTSIGEEHDHERDREHDRDHEWWRKPPPGWQWSNDQWRGMPDWQQRQWWQWQQQQSYGQQGYGYGYGYGYGQQPYQQTYYPQSYYQPPQQPRYGGYHWVPGYGGQPGHWARNQPRARVERR